MDKKKAAMLKDAGAQSEKLAKLVDVQGLPQLVEEMREMMAQQIYMHNQVTAQMAAIVAAFEEKNFNSTTDMRPVERAINSLQALLKQQPVPMAEELCAYRVDFERDQRGLMKPGTVMFSPVVEKLN